MDDLIEFLAVIKNQGGQLSISRLLNNTLHLNRCSHQGGRQANSELQDIPIASRPSAAMYCPHSPADLNLLILLLTQLLKFVLALLELLSLVLKLNLFSLQTNIIGISAGANETKR